MILFFSSYTYGNEEKKEDKKKLLTSVKEAAKEHKLIKVFFNKGKVLILGNLKIKSNLLVAQEAFPKNNKYELKLERIQLNLLKVKSVEVLDVIVKPKPRDSKSILD